MTNASAGDERNGASEGSERAAMRYLRVSNHESEADVDEGIFEDDLVSSLVPPSDPQNRYSRGVHLRIAMAFMKKVGHFLATITLCVMLVAIPMVLYHAISENRKDLAAFDSAGVMVLGTVIMSTRLVYLHLTHWYMPDVQKYVVRILWMVPLYSVQSWLSLRFHEARIYIDTVRDLYEAYVIASFLYYLIELLGGQDNLVRMLHRKNPSLGQHTFPFNLVIQPWELGMEFMLQCKHGVLQYVVIKTLASILTFILEALGCYGEGMFDWRMAYPYLAFSLNISVMYALYCLIKLFHAVNNELCHPVNWHPLGKFLCVKGVVFFTWWQSVVIFYLRAHGFIGEIGNWKADDVATGLQDYCICIEMVFFAIAHSYTFTYKEYLPQSPPASIASDYCPPNIRTLPHPMAFRDAFWSSTLPKETLNDIQRLRNGVDNVMNQKLSPGGISLLRHVDEDDGNRQDVV
jgi:hypothetical protein